MTDEPYRFGELFGRIPYGDPDKCWGCGLFRQWDGVTLLCPTCRELQRIYLFAHGDPISRGDRIHYENAEALVRRRPGRGPYTWPADPSASGPAESAAPRTR